MQILTRDTRKEKKKKKKATICHQKSLSIFFFSQRELFPFPRRARGLIQTYSSAYLLLRLPLLSPPISSRANSELICNSRRRRNWCLILALGNRIMWVMREGRKKERKREGERQEKKRQTFWYEESFALSWLFLFFSMRRAGIHHNICSRLWHRRSRHRIPIIARKSFECHC